MSQPIDRSEAIKFLDALRRRESPLVFWSIDKDDVESSVEGYVTSVNETLLDIENLQDEMTFVLIAGVDFLQMEMDEVPAHIRALAKDSFDFVLGFQAANRLCCVMAKDLRDTVAARWLPHIP